MSMAAAYTVESLDKEDYQVRRMAQNYLGGSRRAPGSMRYTLQLNLQKVTFSDGRVEYSFYVRVLDLERVLIGPGETLELSLDGREINFSGVGGAKFRKEIEALTGELLYQESAYWHGVTPEQIKQIAGARTVFVKIKGENKSVSGFFSSKNFSNFRRFISEYVK